MDATAARRKPTPAITTPRANWPKIHKLEPFSIHGRFRSRISDAYQQLILLKAPTNEPAAGRTFTPTPPSPPQLPSTIENHTLNGAPTDNGQQFELWDRGGSSFEHSAEPGLVKSNLRETHGPARQEGSLQGTVEDADDAPNRVKGCVSQSDGLPSTTATSPFRAPTAATIIVEEKIKNPAITHYPVEIPFNGYSTEKLSKSGNCYMDKAAMIPDALNDEWNKNIKPMLDREVKVLIQGMNGGKDNIHSTTRFNMVGTKHGERLLAEPTIVISCGTKDCKRKLTALLNDLKMHHLVAFDHPVHVRYQPQPASWAVSLPEEPPHGDSAIRLPNLQDVAIEQNDMPAISGLKMKFDILQAGTVQQHYATLGGVIGLDEDIFIMTTAHTFLADMDSASEAHCQDSCSDSDGDVDPAEISSSVPSPPHNKMTFASLWTSRIKPAIAYSFLGQVVLVGNSTSFYPSISDWALFEVVSANPVLSKFATSAKMSSVLPALQLNSGGVQILDTVNTRCTGFLSQTSASIHTGQAVMNVREVLLDSPLSSGASGAWVVRENKVCGYVVAMAGSGRSCFMVTMDCAFREMEAVHGKKVKLGRELRDLINKNKTVGQATSLPPNTPEDHIGHLGAGVAHDDIPLPNNLEPSHPSDKIEYPRWHAPKMDWVSILPEKRRHPDRPKSVIHENSPEFEDYVGDVETGVPRRQYINFGTAKHGRPVQRWLNFLIILSLTYLNSFASTVIAPSVPLIMRDFHSSNHAQGCFIVSVYVLGQITGPLLLLPLSDTYGRCIMYHISNILFIISNIACSVAPSKGSLIGFRFLAGCAAACPLAIGYRSMEEMYPDEKTFERVEALRRRHGFSERSIGYFKERDQADAALTIASMLGSSIGPVPGGYLAENRSWRFVFGIVAILGGLVEASAWFLMSETNERTRFRLSTAGRPTTTPYHAFRHSLPRISSSSQAISQAARLLRSSRTMATLVLYLALMKGYMYLLYTTLTPICTPNHSYATQWHLGPGEAGLAFLAIFTGSIFGSLFGYVLFQWVWDWIDQKIEREGKTTAQDRRLPLVPGSLIICCGLFGFGWSVVKAEQLVVPLAATLLVSFGTSLMVLTIEAYLADIFVHDTADARNASNFLGSLFGGLLPVVGQGLYVSPLGIEWTYTVFGIVALAILKKVRSLWRRGKYLNRWPTGLDLRDVGIDVLDEHELRALKIS